VGIIFQSDKSDSPDHAFLPTTPPYALYLTYIAVFEAMGEYILYPEILRFASVCILNDCHLFGGGGRRNFVLYLAKFMGWEK
jgi:hypothetical protein